MYQKIQNVALRFAASIISLLILASAVFAQSQSTTTEAPPADVKQKQFGDWSYRCVQSADKPDQKFSASMTCELAQSVQVKRGDEVLEVVSLAVSRVKDKANKVNWALVAVTPLDVHLPSKFGIAVGQKTVSTVEYRNCNRFGCWAVLPLANTLLKQFETQNEAAVLFRVLDGKTVRIVFSLKGFTKAFRALESGRQPENM